MKRFGRAIAALAVVFFAVSAEAAVKEIDIEKLPQDPAVRVAYADVASVEAMVSVWSPQWRYATPKTKVAAQLQASLTQFQNALAVAPNNEELLLLIGLTAHYAYNADVDKMFQVAVDALARAEKVSPRDYRPQWFLGIHQCQSNVIDQGMTKLLAVEAAYSQAQLPWGFWDDYMNCALVANMPAHAVRAGAYAARLDVNSSPDRESIRELARKRFKVSDVAASYAARDVWSTENIDSQTQFTSTMFGLSFRSHDQWKANLPDIKNGFTMVQFEAGPHAGNTGDVFPNIVVIVRPPKPGETLNDFQLSFLHGATARPVNVAVCPSQECLTVEIVQPTFYKLEGGGHFIAVVFKRDSPEFPGLPFEQAQSLPTTGSQQPQVFHAGERFHRLAEPLYYLVGLDTADSILVPAKHDYEEFLKTLKVD